jgi:hypothetical protein
MVYYRLAELPLTKEHFPAAARLLAFLLLAEHIRQIWDTDQIDSVVERFVHENRQDPSLSSICEQLARIGSPRAREFHALLDQQPPA